MAIEVFEVSALGATYGLELYLLSRHRMASVSWFPPISSKCCSLLDNCATLCNPVSVEPLGTSDWCACDLHYRKLVSVSVTANSSYVTTEIMSSVTTM